MAVLLAILLVPVVLLGHQVVYWNVRSRRRARRSTAEDTSIALLRAETRHRNPWIADQIRRHRGAGAAVLDLGCGGGFLANYLGRLGHRVTGLDAAAKNLVVAREHDRTGRVEYQVADARALPFGDRSFDAVCAMDLLEHVEHPAGAIAEAGRVLAPSGLFFFHTFNRTWRAKLLAIAGVDRFAPSAPRVFLTPDEVRAMLRDHGLELVELRGSRPRLGWPFWRMLLTGRVSDRLAFTFTDSTRLGFSGYARKRQHAPDRVHA